MSIQDPILHYGGVYTLALAYAGTSNNDAVRQLLHIAVSDTSDDVRRAAVMSLASLLFKNPGQVPRSFDSGSRNRTAQLDYLNLLYFPLKRIEFLVVQVVMPHCEEYLYHSARQGLIDVPRFDENLVSVNPTLHLWPAREIWISWTLTCTLLKEMRCAACDTTRPAKLQYSSRLPGGSCSAEGGVAVSDLPFHECCYPSHNVRDDSNKPAVLIACYTVGQNAQRIGSLIN